MQMIDNINQIFNDLVEKKENGNSFLYVFEHRWTGYPYFIKRTANKWISDEEKLTQIFNALQQADTFDEAEERIMRLLRIFGTELVVEGTLAMLLLEYTETNFKSLNMLQIMREKAWDYEQYLQNCATEFEMKYKMTIEEMAKETYYELFQWGESYIDKSLINRRKFISQSLQYDQLEDVMTAIFLSVNDIFEDTALICSYLAHRVSSLRNVDNGEI